MMKFNRSKLNSTLLAVTLAASVSLTGLTGCRQASKDYSTPSLNATSENETKPANQSSTNTIKPTENSESTSKDTQTTTKPTVNAEKPTKDAQSTTKPTSPETQAKEVYYGQWIIKEVLAYGQAGTYTKETAESLLGKSLSFSAEKATNFGEQSSDISKVITSPVYKKRAISKGDFISTYRMTFDKLGIEKDIVSEVTVSGSKGNVCTFFIKDDNTLIIYGGDTYFKLTRK